MDAEARTQSEITVARFEQDGATLRVLVNGAIAIEVGGSVVVKPIRLWHDCALRQAAEREPADWLASELVAIDASMEGAQQAIRDTPNVVHMIGQWRHSVQRARDRLWAQQKLLDGFGDGIDGVHKMTGEMLTNRDRIAALERELGEAREKHEAARRHAAEAIAAIVEQCGGVVEISEATFMRVPCLTLYRDDPISLDDPVIRWRTLPTPLARASAGATDHAGSEK